MARVLESLYETVHALEAMEDRQRWQETTQTTTLKRLRDCIVAHFNKSEFNELCFDMGVNIDSLEGESLTDLARELVLLFKRTGRCEDLMEYCRENRPNAELP